ncbi:MAG TPA: ComEC/Rec2 family competence protein [Mycobacterium sp.]|nr:ComEC/Rec2 family competence protein [Mycobacterium sp.]
MTDAAPEARQLDLRLVPAALTCWGVTAAGILWPAGVFIAAGFVTAGAVLWFARDRMPRYVSGLLAVCVVGAGFGFAAALRAHSVSEHPIVLKFGTTADVAVTPTESPRSVGHGRVLFNATMQRLDGHQTQGRVAVFASGSEFSDIAAGQPMAFAARIGRPHRHDLTVATLTTTGKPVIGQASRVHRMARKVRERFAAAVREVLPAAQAAMLPALVLGDMTAVSEATVTEFRIAGLTHLTAVSGANVTIVCGAVLFAARLIGPRSAVALAALALGTFVIVVQPSPSVLRAAVMGAIALLGVLTARRRQAIPALAATVLVLMIVAPQLAVDVGFALSVSATAALVVLAPGWSLRLTARGWPKPLADAVCVAVAAQLVTAPLVAGISGQFSVVAVAANLVVAPAVAPITVLGTAAAALTVCWPAAAQLLIRFTGPQVWWLLSVARCAARVPGATLAVPSGALGVLILGLTVIAAAVATRWRLTRRLLLVGAIVALGWSISGWLAGPLHGAVGAP